MSILNVWLFGQTFDKLVLAWLALANKLAANWLNLAKMNKLVSLRDEKLHKLCYVLNISRWNEHCYSASLYLLTIAYAILQKKLSDISFKVALFSFLSNPTCWFSVFRQLSHQNKSTIWIKETTQLLFISSFFLRKHYIPFFAAHVHLRGFCCNLACW